MLKWRNTYPEVLLTRIEDAIEARLYLLRQSGPTGFHVKEHDSDKKYKVFLGSIHSCNCPVFLKEKELCKHILWILIRKFRIPKNNPVVYQLGLCERELNNVIYGRKEPERKIVKTVSAGNDRDIQKQKKIEADDVCPICQEDLVKSRGSLTYCRFGCGNSIHITCMKIWSDHQVKSTGDSVIKCPLCRTEFANHKVILQDYQRAIARKKTMQRKVENNCRKCGIQVVLERSFRCSSCSNFRLCAKCFETKYHSEHDFEYWKNARDRWKAAVRYKTDISLMPSILKLCMMKTGFVNDEKESPLRSLRRPTLRKHEKTQTGSQPDLRYLSIGISGMKLHEQVERNPSPARVCGSTRLPPLSLGSGVKRRKHSDRKDSENNTQPREDISQILVSLPMSLNTSGE